MLLTSFVLLVAVLLVILAFALVTMLGVIFVVSSGAIHWVGFIFCQAHFVITTPDGCAPGEIHIGVDLEFDSVVKLWLERAVVMVEFDGGELEEFEVGFDIFVGLTQIAEVLDLEGKLEPAVFEG